MTFVYKELTVSGSRADTEGTAKFIQEAKLFLEEAGWTTFDDQSTAVAGSHLITFSSNGEEDTFPTFYIVLNSGTTAAQNSNTVSLQVATNWDAGAHDEGSGVIAPTAKITQAAIEGDSNGDFNLWMSGDSQGVVFVTRNLSTQYDSVCIGRANQFHTLADDTHPLYINGGTGAGIIVENTVNVRGIVGNPPRSLNDSSEGEIQSIAFATANQPYNLGSVTSVFFAQPLIFTADDASPIRKGYIGTLRNAWGGAGTSAGMLQEGTLIASGTDFGEQVYRAFTVSTVDSLIIRQS